MYTYVVFSWPTADSAAGGITIFVSPNVPLGRLVCFYLTLLEPTLFNKT
jgi:hypothetical protein